MNKIFRVIFNHNTGTWVAVSELQPAKGKTKSSTALLTAAAITVAGALASSAALAEVTLNDSTGTAATASGTRAIAIGSNAQATGAQAVAIGESATASAANGVALGYNTTAAGVISSIAIGSTTTANQTSAIAIGNLANATAESAAAFGSSAQATGERSVAFGSGSVSTANRSIAVGDNSNASAEYAFAMGINSKASGKSSLAAGSNANASGESATAIGNQASTGKNGVAVGATATNSNDGVSVGYGANSTVHSTAVGFQAKATGDQSSAFGYSANASAKDAIAVGFRANATTEQSIAIGRDSNAVGQYTNAFGFGANASGSRSVAIGYNAKATESKSIALGDAANTTAGVATNSATLNGVTYSGFAGNSLVGVVSVGTSGEKRQIQNVAAGQITATSTDAINGSQLYQVINSTVTYFHTNSTVAANRAGVAASAQAGGANSIAAGPNASTGSSAAGSIAMGLNTSVTGGGTVAIGRETSTTSLKDTTNGGTSHVAIGDNATISAASGSIAIGAKAKVVGNASTNDDYQIAIGANATTSAYQAVAIGRDTQASANHAVALGYSSNASGQYSMALGQSAVANNSQNIALGFNSNSTGTGSLAIGATANSTGQSSVALGKSSQALADYTVAIGQTATANKTSATAVGVNSVASGTQSTALGTGAKAQATSAVAIGDTALANATNAAAVGMGAKALAGNALAMGNNANASGADSVSIGVNSVANSQLAASLGSGAKAQAQGALSLGASSVANKAYATAVGGSAQATGTNATAVGVNSTANATDAVAIGQGANASTARSVALGDDAVTRVATQETQGTVNGITYTGFAGTSPVGVVSLGTDSEKRQLINVAAGQISATSTDAINGSQLYLVANAITTTTAITAQSNGRINTPTTNTSTPNLVNATTVAQAINDSGFTTKRVAAITNASAWTINASDTTETASTTINPGEELNFGAGYGLVLKRNETTNGVEYVYGLNVTQVKQELANGTVTVQNIVLTDSPSVTDLNDGVKDGKVAVGKGGDEQKGITAINVSNAINQSGWKLQNNNANVTVGSEYDIINPADLISFNNGSTTTAKIVSDPTNNAYNVTFEVNKATVIPTLQLTADANQITVNTAGKVVAPTNATVANNTFVTADVLTNVVNQAGFTLKASATTDGTLVHSDGDEVIQAGETVEMVAGKNLTVKQEANGKITYAVAENVTFNNANFTTLSVGNTTASGSPVVNFTAEAATIASNNVVQPANALNITSNGTATQIVGVGSTLNTTTVTTSPTGSGSSGSATLVDLVNATTPNAAATVGDLQNMGWIVSAAGNSYVDAVKNANEVEFIGSGLAEVTGATSGNKRTITVNVNAQNVVNSAQLPVVYTDANGNKVVKDPVSGKFYPADANGQPDTTQAEIPASSVIASMNNGSNNTTTPTALANVKGNLQAAYNVGDMQEDADRKLSSTAATTGTTSVTAPSNVANIYNNAATVGDVLNAGWNLQGNGTAVDFVKAYDTVNFVNGNGTTAVVTTDANNQVNNVTFNVNKTTLSVADSTTATTTTPAGKVVTPTVTYSDANGNDVDAGDVTIVNGIAYKTSDVVNGAPIATASPLTVNDPTNSYVTAADLANVLNKTGFTAKASGNDNGSSTNELINAGDTLELAAGKNLTVTQTNGKFEFATADDVEFTTVKVGNTKLSSTGNTLTVGDTAATPATKNTDGSMTMSGGTQITNVASAGDITNPANAYNAVNAGDLNNAITAVQTGAIKYKGNDGTEITKNLGGTINIVGANAGTKTDSGANIFVRTQNDAVRVELAKDVNLGADGSLTTGNTTVSDAGVTVKNGNNATTIGAGTTSYTDGTNTTTVNATGITINNSVADPTKSVSLTNAGLNNGGNKITNVAEGTDLTDAVNVSQLNKAVAASKEKVTSNNKTVTIQESTDPSTGAAIFDLAVNTGTSLKVDATTGKIDVNTDNNTITTDTTGAIKVNTTPLTNTNGAVDTPTNPNALATAGDIAKAINNSGFNLTSSNTGTSTGVTELINPSDTVTINGGKNINVSQSGSTITVATKDDVEFTTVTVPTSSGSNVVIGNTGINAGNTKITGVAAGDVSPNSTDAVNGSQIYALTGGSTTTVAPTYTATNADGTTVTLTNVTLVDGKPIKTYDVESQKETYHSNVISAVQAMNDQGIKFFHTNNGTTHATGQVTNSEDAQASGQYATAIGYKANASGTNAIAIGHNATASATNTISIGNGNQVNGENSGAFGDPSIVNATNSYSVGNNNTLATGQTDVFVLGNNVTVTESNSVALGTESAITAGTSVGTAAKTSTGATGSTTTAGATGTVNTATVGGITYGGFAGATAVGAVSVGASGAERRIQNVAAGEISATSTDAINGSQLYAVAGKIGQLGQTLGDLSNKINDIEDNADAGTAAAMAVAGLPQAYLPGKSMVSVAGSTYRGQQGYAVGVSAITDGGNWVVKGAASSNSKGHFGATIGAGYQW